MIPNPVELSNSFSQIAKQVEPSVVNISTDYLPKAPAAHARQRPPAGRSAQPTRIRTAAAAWTISSIASSAISAADPEMPQRRGQALGSGVVVDRAGYILTNNHVVDKADRIRVKFTHDPVEYDAKVIGVDAATDLAVIRVEGKTDLTAAKIGNSDAVQVGDWAIAIGSPFGYQATVTAGIISAKERDVDPSHAVPAFPADRRGHQPGQQRRPAAEHPRRSDRHQHHDRLAPGGYQGIGFALPINTAANVSNFCYHIYSFSCIILCKLFPGKGHVIVVVEIAGPCDETQRAVQPIRFL